MTDNQTRKNSTPIKVYCFPEEKMQIEANAAAAGLSVAAYLRKVGMGYEVESIVDIE
ncbi:conjugal transfer protein TraJ, partial [Klebsiella pneumoniae]|nr:conjugal transfer protein TraJ [Klebsiella pneumoniae]